MRMTEEQLNILSECTDSNPESEHVIQSAIGKWQVLVEWLRVALPLANRLLESVIVVIFIGTRRHQNGILVNALYDSNSPLKKYMLDRAEWEMAERLVYSLRSYSDVIWQNACTDTYVWTEEQKNDWVCPFDTCCATKWNERFLHRSRPNTRKFSHLWPSVGCGNRNATCHESWLAITTLTLLIFPMEVEAWCAWKTCTRPILSEHAELHRA